MKKLSFYEVDNIYVKYLREHGDEKVPRIDYETHQKFFCGVIFSINNFNYFAPVSSYNKKRRTAFLIYDNDKFTKEQKPISSLRLSFMFPCPSECLNIKKFEYEDIKYQILLRKELKYCNVHREKIEKLANEVYMLGKNENTRKRFNICNFEVLEKECKKYCNQNFDK